MTVGGLHHIEFYVSDLERSLDFWGWFLSELDYKIFQEWEEGRSWKKENMYIVLVQADERFLDIPYHRRRVGLNHLAFHAQSRKHVDEMTESLKKRGVTILYTDQHPYAGGTEHYAVYFEDPDRMKVELVAPILNL
ncbi:VOC family protein [Evansella halocellulosilytica]|uniref:VOC family protein n=1 Tax=Evansella halocellulosilytica TaxID=2011013 RepID=UPI000BB84B59|nr:VOC family protein [Evansella halocellulosilytica]